MDRVAEEFDQGVVDLLAWLLDTETRARIYVHLRQSPGSTSDEIADGTGLYPSTVRESLAELTEEGILERTKRQNEGAGNNPYEYTAIPPSDLVGGLIGQIQDELNAIVNLDQFLGDSDETEERDEPVRIEVRDSEE
ncbi:MAG: winged helix-turn-helix transcriptional regulator [Halobacteriales archaeon]